jgi:DNA-binding CsgD family transcriptional regulator
MDHLAAGRIIGRQAESLAIERFVESIPGGPRTLWLEGDAGIGKTTLWRHGIAVASRGSCRVLSCRGSESEAVLSFTALADLLDDVADELVPRLPIPQARALDAALLRADSPGSQTHQRAVSVALLSCLRLLSESGAVLVALDDAHWLDPASSRLIEFAVRRLREEPVGILVVWRAGSERLRSSGLERTALGDRLERVALGPLNLGELYHVVREATGHSFSRLTMLRIDHASRGNPLHAIELARALLSTSIEARAGEPLPVPEDLRELLAARVNAVTEPTRRVILLAATTVTPSAQLVAQAFGDDVRAARARRAAVRAGILGPDSATLTFTHPLLGATVYQLASPAERRWAHRALSEVVTDPEARAKHLALSLERPDTEIAASLEAAARRAAARGAPEGAVDLISLAIRLTPPGDVDDRERRSLEQGRYLLLAGDTGRVRRLVEPIAVGAATSSRRAQARLLLARLAWLGESSVAAVREAEAGLAEAVNDPRIRAEAHAMLAELYLHDKRRGLVHARAAVRLLRRDADSEPGWLARSLLSVALTEAELAGPLRRDLIAHATALDAIDPPLRVLDRIEHAAGPLFLQRDEFQEARRRFDAALRAALDEGDESSVPRILDHLAQLELFSGNWPAARAAAERQRVVAEQAEQVVEAVWARIHLAYADALTGQLDEARREAATTLAIGESSGDPVATMESRRVLGLVALSVGDASEAVAHYSVLDRMAEQDGTLDPGSLRHHADFVEAFVADGQLEAAVVLTDRLDGRARPIDHPSGLAAVARCRAVLASDLGDHDAAVERAHEALRRYEAIPLPFEAGRTWLLTSAIHRRRKARTQGREAAHRASDVFASLGANLWLQRAQAEERRLGGSSKRGTRLTETERQVAELSALGLTNREVASRLFMSPKTVEFNLSKVYRKLQISSRAELGARLAPAVSDRLPARRS